MTEDTRPRGPLTATLRDQIASVRLTVGGEAWLAGADIEDPGTMDWSGAATVTVWPEDEEPRQDGDSPGWWDSDGVALSAEDAGDGGRRLTLLEADGLLVDLWRVGSIFDALDARSGDYARFAPMFGDRGSFGELELAPELEDSIEPVGSKVIIVDRVRLAPAWRGMGGVGRLLTARLLRWIGADARAVALTPFPIDLTDQEQEDSATFDPALAWVRRTWQSLGFEPFTDDIWIMDPHAASHDHAVEEITRTLGLDTL